MLPRLTTARLALRAMEAEDIDDIWQMLLLPDVRRFLCDDRLLPRVFVTALADENPGLAERDLGLRIIRDADGFAGFIGLKPVSEPIAACIPEFRNDIEITIALAPARGRLGYAAEAIAAVLAEWDGAHPMWRLAAVADVPNLRSRAMLERAGFLPAGEFPGPAYRLAAYVRPAPRIVTS